VDETQQYFNSMRYKKPSKWKDSFDGITFGIFTLLTKRVWLTFNRWADNEIEAWFD
jgi:hypothetical protein